MTANNFQALCAERAQLIGFPPSVTVPTGEMGLANANILRGSAISSNTNHNINNNNNNNENDSNNNNHNNSISNKLSAKRCLFGSPAKGETEHMYNQYMEITRQEFRDRFGFDIIQGCPVTQTEQFLDKKITTTTTNNTTAAVSKKLLASKNVKGSSKLVDNSNSKTTIESFSEVVDDNKISGECRLQEGNHHNESDTDNETDTCNQDINSSRSSTTTTSNSNINSSTVQSSTNNSSQKDKRTTERFQPYSKRQQNESTENVQKSIRVEGVVHVCRL